MGKKHDRHEELKRLLMDVLEELRALRARPFTATIIGAPSPAATIKPIEPLVPAVTAYAVLGPRDWTADWRWNGNGS